MGSLAWVDSAIPAQGVIPALIGALRFRWTRAVP
jgi:hypothetical protein